MRRIVISTGLGCVLAGVVVVLAMPLPIGVRAALIVTWLVLGVHELAITARSFRDCQRIYIDNNGDASVCVAEGSWRPAMLDRGSVVLSRCAWLRLVRADGCRHAELLRGNTLKNKDWRRFQVIWRQLGEMQ